MWQVLTICLSLALFGLLVNMGLDWLERRRGRDAR